MKNALFAPYAPIECLLLLLKSALKKNQVSQANKQKREERLNEIEELLQHNKELQDQINQKLDEARALNATTEVTKF